MAFMTYIRTLIGKSYENFNLKEKLSNHESKYPHVKCQNIYTSPSCFLHKDQVKKMFI